MRFVEFVVVAAVGILVAPSSAASAVDFAKDVQPIFQARCVSCHGPDKQRSGLRLDGKAAIESGAQSGPIVVKGKSRESMLVRRLLGDGVGRMPPKGEPLSKDQIELVRRWIDGGAAIPEAAVEKRSQKSTEDAPAFRPIVRPPIPKPPPRLASWVRTPIDAFIVDKLVGNGLEPSPEADRRNLIRRVAFDLTGLPPSPNEVSAFIADPAEDAYERLVDRLLSSPRYGERWARHWLDVAHYADSHGHDQDRPRPNAWPYRDYVIRAFNADKPYPRFVEEQIAGDAMFPGDAEAVRATGFLAAGPWDESGLRDIQADTLDREAARNLDRDDIVTSTMATFAGVTVNCARCHDHKFDPIPQEDYYALQAVFAGIDKAERVFDADPSVAARRKSLNDEIERLRSSTGEALTPTQGEEIAAFERSVKNDRNSWSVLTPETWKSKQGASLKALLDRSVLSVGSRPDRDTYTITAPIDAKGVVGLRLELLCDDTLPHQGPGRQDNGNLHLSEIRVTVHPQGKPEMVQPAKVKRAAADFEQVGWDVGRAIDGDPTTAWGIHPAVGRPHAAVFEFERPIGVGTGGVLTVTLDQLHGGGHLIGRFRLSTVSAPISDADLPMPAEIAEALAVTKDKRTERQRSDLGRWVSRRRLERELASLPPSEVVYCGTNRFKPDGSFKPSEGPRPVHLLQRGEISRPGKVVVPGTLQAVKRLPARFQAASSSEGERRIALAKWLTDRGNPLAWRVAVNRVWHYHFGRGLIDTPNDHGNMGGTPSHPELLDWLAAEFRDSGGSLKRLHRLILTSSAFRQSVRHDAKASAKDADNRLLWRMNRTRLDAESIRDSVLLASERMTDLMYGPPVMHFLTKPGIHVTPEADYDRFDVDVPEARRRSVYRFILRTRPDPMMAALDCPEASLSAPVRQASIGAPQSLVLWNDKFMLRYAEHLAALAEREANVMEARIQFVAERLLGREPTSVERSTWTKYANAHGLANLCRVLFNSSEFLFVD